MSKPTELDQNKLDREKHNEVEKALRSAMLRVMRNLSATLSHSQQHI